MRHVSRPSIFLAAALAVFVALVPAVAQTDDAAQVTLTLFDATVDPRSFSVTQGQAVQLTIWNQGSKPLDFHLEGHADLDPIPAGETRTVDFQAAKRGSFFYWSSTHSHADMGTMTVTDAAGTAEGASTQAAFLGLLAIPLLFGLIGFVEPCSVGANILFLAYLNRMTPIQRFAESAQFTLTRASFLGLVGLGASFLGSQLEFAQAVYNVSIGAAFVVGGVAYVAARRNLFAFLTPNVGARFAAYRKGKSGLLGLTFGLSAPLCAAPLLFFLIAGSFLLGPWEGFLIMFVFGLGLSLPILLLARSERGTALLSKVGRRAARLPLIVSLVFIGIGVYLVVAGLLWNPFAGHSWMDWLGRFRR